ncbi:hypothetical protein GCM10023263_53600 [Phytohabitans rumicis]
MSCRLGGDVIQPCPAAGLDGNATSTNGTAAMPPAMAATLLRRFIYRSFRTVRTLVAGGYIGPFLFVNIVKRRCAHYS